jgi:hypothetical protein
MSTQFNFLFGGTPAQPPLAREDYLPPRSRTEDPLSSKRAERELKASGVMRGQRAIALQLVTDHPGRTAAQLAEIHSPYDEVLRFKTMIFLRKRLPELFTMKEVHPKQIGHSDQTWWPGKGE